MRQLWVVHTYKTKARWLAGDWSSETHWNNKAEAYNLARKSPDAYVDVTRMKSATYHLFAKGWNK